MHKLLSIKRKNKVRKTIGLFLALLGLVTAVLSFSSITGFAIASGVTGQLPFLGSLLLIIGGLILTTAQARVKVDDLSDKVGVYDSSHGKSHDHAHAYHLVDPYLNFGKSPISLAEFKHGVNQISGDPELMSIVRNEYGSRLMQIVENGGERAPVARQFLSVLGVKQEEREILTHDDREEIKRVFKDYSGQFTKPQREVLEKHGIGYQQSENHWRLTLGENKITTSSSPSDWRVGRKVAADIIHLIERRGKKSH